MIFAFFVGKRVKIIMAESRKIKSRIDEIRNRVFQAPPNEQIKTDIVKVIAEQDVAAQTLVERKHNQISSNFVKDKNFIESENQFSNDIKNQFGALEEKLIKKLNDFEVKIPDLEKGSRFRVQLDSEIGDIISQRLSTYLEALSEQIQQSRTLNRTIEDQNESYARTDDLNEITKGLEELIERNINIKLEKLNSSIQDDFSSVMRSITLFNEELDTKHKQTDDKITVLSSLLQNSMAKITLDFTSQNSSLEASLFQKVEYSFDESISKLNELETIVTDNIVKASKASDAIKKDLEIRLEKSLAKLGKFNLYSK